MSALAKLRAANTRDDLAEILKIKPKDLSYILYKTPPAAKYSSFEVKKSSGGTRIIQAPNSNLKSLQKAISNILYDCLDEIMPKNSVSSNRSLSHGFQRDRNLSIISNGTKHKNRRYVFNLDLKDFFGSFNFGRVRGYFLSNKDFALKDGVATTIAQIVCFDNRLPQGAPSSPIITELIARILDVRLSKLANSNGCSYSRYVDDLTFSTNKQIFPNEIALSEDGAKWKVGSSLAEKIVECGFEINESKTRMQFKDSRQETTGLVINKKVNVSAEYKKKIRSMTYSLFETGTFFAKDSRTKNPFSISIAALAGKIEHMFHVKSREYLDDNGRPFHIGELEKDKQSAPSFYRIYRDFIFFNYFCNNQKPVIVCEGLTDNIYLKAAMKRGAEKFETLASVKAKPEITLLLVDFYSYSKSSNLVMTLTGGASPLKKFVEDYQKQYSRFKSSKSNKPVILVVDNDSANNPLWSMIKNKYKIENADGSEKFYHVINNLFIVPIPKIDGKDTYIEHLFDEATLKIQLQGKSFDVGQKGKTIDENKYGKTAFAKNVVAVNRDKIDFSGFDKLLQNIEAVIKLQKK